MRCSTRVSCVVGTRQEEIDRGRSGGRAFHDPCPVAIAERRFDHPGRAGALALDLAGPGPVDLDPARSGTSSAGQRRPLGPARLSDLDADARSSAPEASSSNRRSPRARPPKPIGDQAWACRSGSSSFRNELCWTAPALGAGAAIRPSSTRGRDRPRRRRAPRTGGRPALARRSRSATRPGPVDPDPARSGTSSAVIHPSSTRMPDHPRRQPAPRTGGRPSLGRRSRSAGRLAGRLGRRARSASR